MATSSKSKQTTSTKKTSSTASKGGTTTKKSTPRTPKLPAGVSLANLATADDVTWLGGQSLPSVQSKQPAYGLPILFTPAVVTCLESANVTGFYGSALNIATLQSDATLASDAAGARDRFQASSIGAGRVFGVPGKALAQRVSLLMSRWDAFEAAFPNEAATLDTLRAYWTSTHKTGPKKSSTSTTSAAPAPVVPTTPVSAPVSASAAVAGSPVSPTAQGGNS